MKEILEEAVAMAYCSADDTPKIQETRQYCKVYVYSSPYFEIVVSGDKGASIWITDLWISQSGHSQRILPYEIPKLAEAFYRAGKILEYIKIIQRRDTAIHA